MINRDLIGYGWDKLMKNERKIQQFQMADKAFIVLNIVLATRCVIPCCMLYMLEWMWKGKHRI